MDISKMSVTELKALKADCYEIIELNRNNLVVINAEIEKRNKQTDDAKKSVEESKA